VEGSRKTIKNLRLGTARFLYWRRLNSGIGRVSTPQLREKRTRIYEVKQHNIINSSKAARLRVEKITNQ
jgi:hypothetical protein